MLVLSRKENETIVIRHGDAVIRVHVVKVKPGNIVRIGIDAPESAAVNREEIDILKWSEGAFDVQ